MGNLEYPAFLDPEIAVFVFPTVLLSSLFFILAACNGYPDRVRHPIEDQHRPLFLQRHQGFFRTFEKGQPKFDRKTASQDTLQADTDPSRLHVYAQVFRTAPAKVWKSVMLSAMYSLGMSWGIVNGVHYDKVELSSVFRSLEASTTSIKALLPFTACLIALYVHLRLSRFSQVVNSVGEVAGALEEIAMVVGSSISSHRRDENISKVLWTLYRHLTLVHVLIYMQISVRFEHQSFGDLLQAGYITGEEQAAMKACIDPTGLVTFWVGHILIELNKSEVFETPVMTHLMRSVTDLRLATSNLMQEVHRLAPITFSQIIQFAVDMVCILCTPVLLHKFLSGRSYPTDIYFQAVAHNSTTSTTTTTSTSTTTTMTGVAAITMMFDNSRASIYMMPILGSMFITMIFQGSLQVVRDTEDPFATGMDRLNPDVVLDLTEKRCLAFLRRDSRVVRRKIHHCLDCLLPQSAVLEEHDDDDDDDAHADIDIDQDAGLPMRRKSYAARRSTEIDPAMVASLAEGEEPELSHDDRPSLPTAVVLSEVSMEKLKNGAQQDAKDLHRGVAIKLKQLEEELLHKIEEEDPYLVAVMELVPKLQEDSLANAQLREQVVKTVAGLGAKQDRVLENPTSLRKQRTIGRMSTRASMRVAD